jgi:hypothetical protein
MEIKEFLAPFQVTAGMRAPDKVRLLRELAKRAAVTLGLASDAVADALLQREAWIDRNRRRCCDPACTLDGRGQAVCDPG